MKIAEDKYGRKWLIKGRTYILLTINHTGLVPPPMKPVATTENGIKTNQKI